MFDEPSRGDQYIMGVAKIDQFFYGLARHEGKRSTRELERIDIVRHRTQNILEIVSAHRSIIWAPYLGYARLAGLGITFVKLYE